MKTRPADIAERGVAIEVRGYTRTEVADALDYLARVRVVQADQLAATRDELVRALMSTELPLAPAASLRQAQRLAAHRDALLSTPTHTYSTLAEVRAERPSTTRTWFSRQRAAGRVFSVRHRGRTVIPEFQFTESGDVRTELVDLFAPLLDAGVDGWTIWSWLTRPSSLLSGQVPAEVAHAQPARASTAARRFAQRAAA